MIANCSQCHQPMDISAIPVGSTIRCARCGFIQRFVPPQANDEQVFDKQGMTAREALAFIAFLPDRLAVRQFSEAEQDQVQLAALRNDLQAMTPDSPVIFANWKSLRSIRIKHGWACFVFECASDAFTAYVRQKENTVIHDAKAKSAFSALTSIQAFTEVGVEKDQYTHSVMQCWLTVRDFSSYGSSRFPLFTSVIDAIFANYKHSLDLWRTGAGGMNMQFMGGGFGWASAIKGMADAYLLNSAVGIINKQCDRELHAKIHNEWVLAAQKMTAISAVMNQS